MITKSSPHGFETKDELCVSCLNASSKYKENFKELKNTEKSKNEEETIDALLSNIEIKHQKSDLQRTITELEVDVIGIKRQKQVTMRPFKLR